VRVFLVIVFRLVRDVVANHKTTRYAGAATKVIQKITLLKYNVGVQALCKYHIVFTPKYRRKVIYNQYRNSLREILRRLCEYKGVKIIEGELMADHVHMLVLIPPKISVSSFMGYLKGKSALMMFDKHANLKYKFGNRHFWSEGYYVSTVGLNEATGAFRRWPSTTGL